MAEPVRALTVAEVNELSAVAFRDRFGAIFEATPAIAATAAAGRPFVDRGAMIDAFDRAAGALGDAAVLELLRSHPVLGHRGPMARSSQEEQASAGLGDLEADRRDRLAADNRRYLDRFGFPFIIAVHGLRPDDIARALSDRLGHDVDTERETAFTEVRRIATLRLEQQVRASTDRIAGDRLLARLHALRAVGATAEGGVTREAFGPEDVAGRHLVAGWMREAGLEVSVDGAANLIGRRPGRTDRWLASGSHLDTVVDGGWLDGAYGVVAAVEAAAALADGPELRRGLVIVAFANEEGARGTAGMTGSRALVADVGEEELDTADDEDVSLRERLARAGAAGSSVDGARWDLASFDAMVELHIEQGPVLDSSGAVLGAVTAITGRQSVDVLIAGAANHAGTTPMELRRDALAAAAEVVLAIEALPASGAVRVATVGRLEVSPNVRNVVPGHVSVHAELRDEAADRLDAARERVQDAVAEIGARRRVTATTTWGQRVEPTTCDPGVLAVVRDVIDGSGVAWTELPSGAGHDAQILGREIPMGMIFVPSTGGLSHAPQEDTDERHLVAGAQALLDTLRALDAREHP